MVEKFSGGDPVEAFGEPARAWFRSAFAEATAAQLGAWSAIGKGDDVLVVAPTGSGKTLAAFLSALDRLSREPLPEDASRRCRVLYVSPLKALAADVERNLRAPLAGIRQAAQRLGHQEPDVTVAMRTGDTPAVDRRAFTRAPSDILITTPESLFLLLTSQAREALKGVETVILDEVHAVCGTKRGAHLALCLERLDELLERPAQRVGLSATVRPVEEVARYLGGARPVTVVQPPSSKQVELTVEVPVEDMSQLGEPSGEVEGNALGAPRRNSIWPAVEERVLDLVGSHRSTIVFANSRRLAERLCAHLNELAEERTEEAAGLAAASAGPGGPGGRGAGGPGADGGSADVFGPAAGGRGGRMPAEVMAQAGGAAGAPPVVARAHHGSVSREERRDIEEDLKAGRLPAVVATSSLELGIDMGAVDLVVQVEAPPSVASGLQRIGRAGHQVGAASRGVVFPKHRGDLVSCAVVAERMAAGRIEAMRYPRNPLDVLAQQVVAMVSMEPWAVDDLAAVLRRAAPYAELPDSALESVLDMLAGRYPSDDFAELRPRLVWDRVTGVLTARPGAHRLVVTSGGTIPDRGLFGVFLVGTPGETGRRVGELDEEMVYESRVGDVFLLGSTSWRIEEITHDRVLVTPAPGQPARMPFWKGDTAGRPVELGRAIGGFLRELSGLDAEAAAARAAAAGLDQWATTNLLAYLEEQRQATGRLPDDRTILVERFRDELGDWRVVVHSLFGTPVNGPWALAIAARLRERTGLDVQALHSDDGIVLRLPDVTGELATPTADLALFEPEEIEPLVTDEVGGSALFAARFRECAARALLLPRRNPGRRTPLWQQRQRAAQLLGVASEFGSFPIVLETMRECLQDVFDVPGLIGLAKDLQSRTLRVVEVETPAPSPFARSLLFGYVGAFLYEGDAPLAERRAQALALDSSLLSELLGRAELRELLDPAVIAETELQLQRLTEERRAHDVDSTADLLRVLGGLSTAEAAERGSTAEWLAELETTRRAIRVRIAGEERWLAIEDSGRVRDALGVALPVGVPEAFTEPVRDPLGDLVSRYARTHGPFRAAECAERFGLGVAVVHGALQRLAASRRVTSGEFRPDGAGTEWCDAEVLRTLRRRSLAALRKEVEPVGPAAYATFLARWQQITAAQPISGRKLRTGAADSLLRAVEQLQGLAIPASALEQLVLSSRVPGYSPALLDELCTAGEVVWSGAGSLPGDDGWVTLAYADAAPLLLPPAAEWSTTPVHDAVLEALDGGRALFFRALSDAVGASVGTTDDADLAAAVWDLVWAGVVTNDTLAPLRALQSGGRTRHPVRRGAPPARFRRLGRGGLSGLSSAAPGVPRPAMPSRGGPPTMAGRWSLVGERELDPTRRTHAAAEVMLDRYGVVVRGTVGPERLPGGFGGLYRVLGAAEDTGRVRRGYFVEGLGGAQFAEPGAVERLRAVASELEADDHRPQAVVLAATDPANPYGAALPWPGRSADGESAAGDPLGGAEPTGTWAALAGGTPGTGVRGNAATVGAAASASGTGSGGAGARGGAGAGSSGAEKGSGRGRARGHQAGRKSGAVVVLVDGALTLYVERGGKTLLSYRDDPDTLALAAGALAEAVQAGRLGGLTVERADGTAVGSSPLADALEAAGFRATPRGLRLRG
ncbi:ATP-dependent helicase [Cryptosporangium sp. NPDC048952]|uniref:ATP-dependent helicase n=1 Tax=Cryptosporangium sp. NPDC048952 TaxID=3363961 RepID=UPI0037218368